MALFLSTYVNKLDKKGRVSVPASFRAALTSQTYQGVVVFCSNHHPCLEGFSWSYMDELGSRLDNFDLFSDEQTDMSTAIFADSTPLPFDGDGRVILPERLVEFAGIKDQAAFVGLGRKFQIWSPDAYEQRRTAARESVKSGGMTIPKGGAS